MVTAKVLSKLVDSHPIQIPAKTGSIPCALAPFGCTGFVAADRIVVYTDAGPLGNCANWRRHTELVRTAGPGSEVQKVFSWLIGQFQASNPSRVRGSTDPIVSIDLRTKAATA
jgi:hypothetical protein